VDSERSVDGLGRELGNLALVVEEEPGFTDLVSAGQLILQAKTR